MKTNRTRIRQSEYWIQECNVTRLKRFWKRQCRKALRRSAKADCQIM